MSDTGLVLIHGSMLGAWLWQRVTPLLASPHVAVDLPGRGRHPADPGDVRLGDAVQSVASDVEAAGLERVVLVGHSLGGVVAVAAAQALGRRAAGLVFVASIVPREGRSFQAETPFPTRALLSLVLRLQRHGARAPERAFRTSVARDVDEETMRTTILPRLVPEAPRLFLDRLTWGAAWELPRSYLRLTQDREVPPELQDRVIARLAPVEVIEIASGHLPMITHPKEVAAELDRIIARLKEGRP